MCRSLYWRLRVFHFSQRLCQCLCQSQSRTHEPFSHVAARLVCDQSAWSPCDPGFNHPGCQSEIQGDCKHAGSILSAGSNLGFPTVTLEITPANGLKLSTYFPSEIFRCENTLHRVAKTCTGPVALKVKVEHTYTNNTLMMVEQPQYLPECHLLKVVCQLLRLPPRAVTSAFYYLHAYHELQEPAYKALVDVKARSTCLASDRSSLVLRSLLALTPHAHVLIACTQALAAACVLLASKVEEVSSWSLFSSHIPAALCCRLHGCIPACTLNMPQPPQLPALDHGP